MKTTEIKFYELCDEIDYWKERAKNAEADAKHWRDKYSEQTNQRLESAQKGVADALMFALSVRDDENGNLVIDKDTRKELGERFRT